jgi:hypothetical protein
MRRCEVYGKQPVSCGIYVVVERKRLFLSSPNFVVYLQSAKPGEGRRVNVISETSPVKACVTV